MITKKTASKNYKNIHQQFKFKSMQISEVPIQKVNLKMWIKEILKYKNAIFFKLTKLVDRL